ncbi:MAG: hypothetical protein J6O09_00650 [Lachnospiraceae bacterium]|nr:hypothetical protein [Lachnospiraceae bacterium]
MENNSAPIFETGEVKKENVYGSCKRCGKPVANGVDYCDDCIKEIEVEKKKKKSKSIITTIVVIVAVLAIGGFIAFQVISGKGKNTWKEDKDGVLHYYDESGKMAVNTLVSDETGTYYVNEEGIKISEEWAVVDDKSYYFDKDGVALKDTWESIDDKWYAFDKDGVMITNSWKEGDDGAKYYLDKDGHMLMDTLYDIDGNTFYFNPSGVLQPNSMVMVNAGIYFTASDGSVEKNKWVANNTYYVGDDGKMLVNTTTPDGTKVNALGQRVSSGGGSKTTTPTNPGDSSDKEVKKETEAAKKDTTSGVDKSKGVWIENYSSFSDSYAYDGENYIDISIRYPIFGAASSDEAANMNDALDGCREDMLTLATEKIDEENSPKNYKISSANVANVEDSKITVIMKGKLERSGQAARDVIIRFIYDRTSGTGFVRE